MGIGDKLGHKAEEFKGKAKEGVGDLTDNASLENEGRADQLKAKAGQVGEKFKDTGRDLADKADDLKDDVAHELDDVRDDASDKLHDAKHDTHHV